MVAPTWFEKGLVGSRTLAARFADVANVKDFGAVGNNIADDTAAIQAALNTGRSVFLPDGTYLLTGSLTMMSSGQILYGSASGGSGSVLRFTASGSATCITVGTAAPASAISSVGLRDLQITDVSGTGTTLFIRNASRVDLDGVTFATPYNGVAITDSNTVRLNKVSFVSVRGQYAAKWYGTGTTKNDILVLNEVQMSPFSSSASGRATALLVDGYAHTLIINGMRAVRMGRGLHFTNSYGIASEIPEIIFSNDLEVDFPEYEAVRIEAGASMRFVNTYCHGSQLADNIYIAAGVRVFDFNGGPVTGALNHGIHCLGEEVYIRGTIARNSVAGSGLFNGVEVGATAKYVRVEGGAIGRREDLSGLQGYGVAIRGGATTVTVVGNDLTGNVTGAVLDASGVAGTTTVLGNAGTTLSWAHGLVFDASGPTPAVYPLTTSAQQAMRVKAVGTDYVYLGNAQGDSLKVGAATASLVNNFRIAGAASGSSPQILAEGTGTDIDVRLTPKGAGAVRCGTSLLTAGSVTATGTITATAFSGPLTGAVTGAVTGNASTATALSAGADRTTLDTVAAKAPLASPTFTGTVTMSGGAVELGPVAGVASTPFIDFHSGATATDYDSRVIASGGTGVAGQGTLTYQAGSHVFNGRVLPNISDYADDVAAAAAGVPVGALYRTGNSVKVRIV